MWQYSGHKTVLDISHIPVGTLCSEVDDVVASRVDWLRLVTIVIMRSTITTL